MFYISPHQGSFAQSVYFTLISVLWNVIAAFDQPTWNSCKSINEWLNFEENIKELLLLKNPLGRCAMNVFQSDIYIY